MNFKGWRQAAQLWRKHGALENLRLGAGMGVTGCLGQSGVARRRLPVMQCRASALLRATCPGGPPRTHS